KEAGGVASHRPAGNEWYSAYWYAFSPSVSTCSRIPPPPATRYTPGVIEATALHAAPEGACRLSLAQAVRPSALTRRHGGCYLQMAPGGRDATHRARRRASPRLPEGPAPPSPHAAAALRATSLARAR